MEGTANLENNNLEQLLGKAIVWAQEQSQVALEMGTPLNELESELARAVGVEHWELVRILEVDEIPVPIDPELKAKAEEAGLFGPSIAGITFDHGIYIKKGHRTERLVSHELHHVHQYEQAKSIRNFLQNYIPQLLSVGYANAPLELDAQNHKNNLKKFNPDKIAELDLNMWQAYYSHNFFKLFILLLHLNHEFFGLDYFHTLQAAYYSASAAINFRLNRGKENHELIITKLTKFLKIISDNNIEKFNYKNVAELEFKWWMIDRYPKPYQTSREEGLARAMAAIYNTDYVKLTEYANYRAQAMTLQDEAKTVGQEADWEKIGSLLKQSFNSLYQNIQ